MSGEFLKDPVKARFGLPPGVTNTKSTYLIRPDRAFHLAWRDTSPEQANPRGLRRSNIDSIKRTLTTDPDFVQEIPSLGIDIVNGKPEVMFIEGRHRFAALTELGLPEIPAHVETMSPNLLSLSFVKPLPPALKAELEGEGSGKNALNDLLAALDKLPEIIEIKKRWARTAEGREALLKWFKRMGWGDIAQSLLVHYMQNGALPSSEQIQRMQREFRARHPEKPKEEMLEPMPRWREPSRDMSHRQLTQPDAADNAPPKMIEIIERYSQTAKGRQALLKFLEKKGLEPIAEPWLAYYIEHDREPSSLEITKMKLEAGRQLRASGRSVGFSGGGAVR